MLISEVLNSKVPYEVVDSSSTKFSTLAKVGTREMAFVAHQAHGHDEHPADVWEVEFSEIDPKKSWGATYDLTGSGSEFQAFSFVRASLLEFVQRYYPHVIYFTADKPAGSNKRAELYTKIFVNALRDKYNARISDASRVTFWLERKDKT